MFAFWYLTRWRYLDLRVRFQRTWPVTLFECIQIVVEVITVVIISTYLTAVNCDANYLLYYSLNDNWLT